MKNTIKILNDNNIKYSIKDEKIYLEKTILDLSNKNLVGTFDISMIKNLEYLDCSYNKISKIICNEKLNHLYCHGNILSEIVCNINLENISCYKNPILKLNRNNFNLISSDIYVYDNEHYYYYNKTKLEILNNKYFIKRFKNETEILYVYHNYTINYSTQLIYSSFTISSDVYRNYIINSSTLYTILNEKYN